MQETTEFGNVLANAIEASKNDLNSLVWKEKDGKENKLIDMNKDQLQIAYNHTCDMLWNRDKLSVGKYVMKVNIRNLISDCNAELFKRFILNECKIDNLRTNFQLLEFIRAKKTSDKLSDNSSVTELFTNAPVEFETVTIGQLLAACFDKLDVVNRKMISDKFILSQGIWLTDEEKKDLTEYDENHKFIPWLDVIKERLILNNVKLRIDPHGFTYNEFRALIHLPSLPKISELPTNTLKLLRDKVLILLDADTDYHINKWLTIKANIEKVADFKHFPLLSRNYEN